MRHVTRTSIANMSLVISSSASSHKWVRHVQESRDIYPYKWVTSHIWVSRVAHKWVMSHVQVSHIWVMSYLLLRCHISEFATCNEVVTSTGWRRFIGSPKLQIIFHKRATKYMSLLQKMTNKDKGSYESSPLCKMETSCRVAHKFVMSHEQESHIWAMSYLAVNRDV